MRNMLLLSCYSSVPHFYFLSHENPVTNEKHINYVKFNEDIFQSMKSGRNSILLLSTRFIIHFTRFKVPWSL